MGSEGDDRADGSVAADHPELVQLALRRPTLGARVRDRVARDPRGLTALAEGIGRRVTDARVVCECEDVLFGELARALDEGARTLDEVVKRTGLGRGTCGGARCLDAAALHVAWRTGCSAEAARREAASLVRRDAGLAEASLAYARLEDDVLEEEDDDDEPEIVVTVAGARGPRGVGPRGVR
ncbi:MAG: hypothetical protein OHK0013_39600 [Sandaracinaceae bacterium]